MIPEQREALDEALIKIRAGRISRRTFLERTLALGLTATAAGSLLEACGGSGGASVTNLVWQSESDTTGTYGKLADAFNKSQSNVHITWLQGPSSTDAFLQKLTTMLRARSHSIDVMSIDVTYPALFGSSQWTAALEGKWPSSEQSNYLPGPIASCTYQGHLWAAPFRTDLGVLYYRTDLVKTPPTTWSDLVSISKGLGSKSKYGYVWQGAQYEGLVCDFVEVLYGYGGSVLDPNNPKSVTVNSPQAVQALTDMVSWVGTISPSAVTTYMEEAARNVFQQGDAAFMRNWPYAYSLGNDATQSKIANKFDIHPLLSGGSGSVGHSCVGGWNLAVNAFTPDVDAAWSFIHYMLGESAQKTIALQASLTPTLKSIYTDADVLAKQPLFKKLAPILQNSQPRPVSAKYPDVSNAIQLHLHQALLKQSSPSDALNALASDLKTLVGS